tara:strand:- start:3833 stop:5860 length:2028 start_codon:yes stop_codon:yes gene_type:complete
VATSEEKAQVALQEQLARTQLAFGATDQSADVFAATIGNLTAKTDAQREAIIAYHQRIVDLGVAHGTFSEQTKASARALETLTGAANAAEAAVNAMGDQMKGAIGLSSAWKTSMTASFAVAVKEGKGLGQIFQGIKQRVLDTTTATERWAHWVTKASEMANGAFYGVLKQTMNLASSIDNSTVSFTRLTGAMPKFTSQVERVENSLYRFGVSGEEAAQVMGSLYSSVSGFTNMSEKTRTAMQKSSAIMQEMGIDAETSARNIEILNRGMGVSGAEAARLNQQMFGAAQQLGISSKKMLDDFSSMGQQFMIFGNNAVNVFVRLQAAAKQTGVEVNRMLAITDRFNKFDTAAESVGRLNALLGGPYLNTLKMVMATDPTERMMHLSQATTAAGKSFETLGYYERLALTQAMGLQDVNELALVMRGRFDLVSGSVHKTSFEIEKAAEESKRFQSVQDELQQTMRAVAMAVQPLISYIKDLANWLQQNHGIVKVLVPVLIALKGAMMSIQLAGMMAATGLTAMAAAAGPAMLAFGVLSVGVGILAYSMMQKGHSPPLFGEGGGMSMAASQTSQFGSSLNYAAESAKNMTPALRELGSAMAAIPDSKAIKLEKVFQGERDVLAASAGARITEHTVRLLGAAQAGSAGGSVIQNKMDVTVEMDGRIVGHQVANQLSDRRHT